MDDYAFIRGQYEANIRRCEHLLQSAADTQVLARASGLKQLAETELARLNAQQHSRLPKTHA